MSVDVAVPPEPDLSRYGPWTVIAGGSEGVGAEFARRRAGGGVNVVLVARKREPLAEVAESCRALGVEVRTLAVDLTEGGVESVIAATADLAVGLLGVTRTPAMERVGLNFDAPGMVVSEPADVAREGLAHLAHGPVRVVSGNEKAAAWRTARTGRRSC